MRPAPRADAAPAVHQYASQDERDAALEVRYVYDRRGERSTMAYVAAYADALVAEYFAWRRAQSMAGREDVSDALHRWEAVRFGAALDGGPHGALLFAVRWALAPSEGGRYHPPSYDRESSWHERRRQLHAPAPKDLGTAARKALPDMPHAPGRRETDARLDQLQEQAGSMRSEVAE